MNVVKDHLDEYLSGLGRSSGQPFAVDAPLNVGSETGYYRFTYYDLVPGKVYRFDNARLKELGADVLPETSVVISDFQKHIAVRVFDMVANNVLGYGLKTDEMQRALESGLLKRLFGDVPKWSDSGKYVVHNVGVSTGGSFAAPVGFDTNQNDFMFLLIQRGDGKWGLPGGYFNITNGEQPVNGFLRELGEEVRDDKGNPIILPDAQYVIPVDTGLDDRRSLRVQWHGHMLMLQNTQMRLLEEHAQRCEEDPAYAAGVKQSTNNESISAKWLNKAGLREFLKTAEFAHPHEKQVLIKIMDMIDASQELRTAIKQNSLPKRAASQAALTA